jgi:hypothetical protein
MREKPTNATIIHSDYLLYIVFPTCFGITLPSSGSVLSAFVGFSRIILLGILIFKGLTVRRLYKSFGVKGLNDIFKGRNSVHIPEVLNLLGLQELASSPAI